MRTICSALFVLLSTAFPIQAGGDGFVPLFNAKDLTGWVVKETKDTDQWHVKDGVLVAKKGTSWLSTTRTYGDYVLKLEWRLPENGNSGVFLRVPEMSKDPPWTSGMEVQILDDDGPQYKGKLKAYQYCGSIYGVTAAKQGSFKGAGAWNQYEITCRGDQVSVILNGVKVAEADMGKEAALKNRPRQGIIGLQNHGTGVEFRNVLIKVLK